MNNQPIIRLTVENMRHNIQVALSNYTMELDDQIQDAIKAACTPEAIHRLVSDTANQAIEEAVTTEVRNFFAYGDGRTAIRDVVTATLGKAKSEDNTCWIP